MTYRIGDDVDYELEPESRRGHWITIIVVFGLAAIGIISAVVWSSSGVGRLVELG